MSRLPFALALCLATSPALSRDHAALPGIPPGAYSISILSPVIDPALTIDEQVVKLCYTQAEARAHANPIMPAPERAGCDSPDRMVGNDLTWDATCKDGLHNLRLTQIAPDAWSGKYLYVSNTTPRVQLEPAVRLHRDGDCAK